MLSEASDAVRVGELYLSRGEYKKGFEYFEALHRLDPDRVDVLINLGVAAIHLGNYRLGIDAHIRALILDPENDVALSNLAALNEDPALSQEVTRSLNELRIRTKVGLHSLRSEKASGLPGASNTPQSYVDYKALCMPLDGQAFFCLSTGRCGTHTLTGVLGTASNARVYHHPHPQLIAETLAAYHNEIDISETFWQGRGPYIYDAWKDGMIFGGIDHNMTAFSSAIRDDIRRAKFVVLVRNPWDFVRSGMRRKYYRGSSWDIGRLRPEFHHVDAARWSAMTQFEKTCWLWNDTYRRIRLFLHTIPTEHYQIIRFEDLVADVHLSKDLFAFLGLEGFDADSVRQVLSKKLNAQKIGDFPRPRDWDDELHATLERECREQLDYFGYSRGMHRSTTGA